MTLNEYVDRFKKYIYTKGLRFTNERKHIIEAIYNFDGHVNADDLYMRLKKKKIKVSRATIYRSFSLLEECSLIKKLQFGESYAFYEYSIDNEHHDHMICTECGKIIEFYDEELEERQKTIAQNFNFLVSDHAMKIIGLCEVCQDSTEN